MSVNTKHVFYAKYLSQGIFADLLGARLDVRLDRPENDSAEQSFALDGKPPPRMVNGEVWPHYARRFERTFGFAPGDAARQLAGE
jgi:hypothetical protein